MAQDAVARLLRTRFGLDPERLGPWRIENAVGARARVVGGLGPELYPARLLRDEEELIALLEEILVHESWFFRHARSFTHLARHVDPAQDRPIRILSAPCACGEEPYSIAIRVLESGVPRSRVHIDALDISPRAIRQAAEGRFEDGALRAVDGSLRDRHFSPLPDGRWEVSENVRRLVALHCADLLGPTLPLQGRYDVVFARNLLIYLDADARLRLVARIERLLAPGGVLYVGPAEVTAFGACGFEVLDADALALGPAGAATRA